MAKFASLNLFVREVDNGFVAKGTFATDGDEFGPYGGEHVEYIATDLDQVSEYANQALAQFRIKLNERNLNDGQPDVQPVPAGRGDRARNRVANA